MEKKFNMRAALERIEEIQSRMNQIAEGLESENREMSEAEKAERIQLERELNIKQMQVTANTKMVEVREDNVEDANKQIREYINKGQRFEVKIKRDTTNWNKTDATNHPAPVVLADIVKPLYEGLILSKIGTPLMTGLKGNYTWPIVEAFEATVEGEAVALGDTKIPLTKLTAKPERIGIAVPVTREALNETDNIIELVCKQYMPTALASLMNKIMFSASAVTGATNLVGPFVSLKSGHSIAAPAAATGNYANILKGKAVVLNEGVDAQGQCYVMNEITKAKLEAQAKGTDIKAAIVENDMINGVPVFCNHNVADDVVYFGCFKYAPMGLFGEVSFIVDPYTLSRQNAIDFVLNADYALSVLRKEAFAKVAIL